MASITRNSVSQILKILLIYFTLCQGQANLNDNDQMPALYKFDDYDDCVDRATTEPSYPAKYCLVYVQLQPNNDSSVWQQIDLLSSHKYNYRHDHIFRGVCLEKCKDFLENNVNDNESQNGLLINENTEIFESFHYTPLDHIMRHQYHNNIHECVNQEYMEKYNLSTKIFVNYCVHPEIHRTKDIYYYLTILLITVIILLNIFSTIYDAKIKSQQLKPDEKLKYYEVKHSDKVNRYLTAFSLYRNYKRLVVPNQSDIGIDLAFLDGFRTVLCFLIVLEHSLLVQFAHLKNPEFTELLWDRLQTKLLLHALVWLELFFVLSGLLLYVKFEKGQYITPKSSFSDCVQVFVRLLVSRYLRYLPSLIFIIIFTGNINYYYEDGTFARFVLDPNCIACRETWWQNLLMINNYDMKSSCLMHTWYIAADFQLYGLFLLILIIMAKYPKSKVLILAGVAFIAAAINFGVNYILKLDSIFLLHPESYRYFYFKDIETAKHIYFSSYTNINSFLVGIVCGLIYMKYLRKNPENKSYLSRILKISPYIGWPCILAILYLGTTIMGHTETTIWTAAYGLLQRHVGLTIVAIIVILRGFCNGGGIFKTKPFRILARLSYQVYLWQIVVVMNKLAYSKEPLYVNDLIIYMSSILLFVSSNIIAFVVALSVEYPFAEIISIIDIEKKIKPIKTS
ncbi:uncharacterized protein LOC111690114 isoform X1 [Lucilia cuprina]|uniref:uncharacterized protein LOC111690114 isoform X1 n=1 Tax=Lucilia cuprina TaxID=7375 RepID=UPI001F06E6EB|nr:uncharacterized protein LOC111690114 isoform X1 [Lucilia cuprina]